LVRISWFCTTRKPLPNIINYLHFAEIPSEGPGPVNSLKNLLNDLEMNQDGSYHVRRRTMYATKTLHLLLTNPHCRELYVIYKKDAPDEEDDGQANCLLGNGSRCP